jgi:hypothetical protein
VSNVPVSTKNLFGSGPLQGGHLRVTVLPIILGQRARLAIRTTEAEARYCLAIPPIARQPTHQRTLPNG